MRLEHGRLIWGPGTGKKWTARRRMEVRAKGILNLSGTTVRLFQFPGSRHSWAFRQSHNDNGRRMVMLGATTEGGM